MTDRYDGITGDTSTPGGYYWDQIARDTDDCIIAMSSSPEPRPLPSRALDSLPPWRAYALATIAERLGSGLEHWAAEDYAAKALGR